MGMNVGSSSGGDDEVVSAINTTPLVDVMLVLLIIFLITVPVVTQSVALNLPKETNVIRVTKPENIELAVSKDGDIYWGTKLVPDVEELVQRLGKESVKNPQPEVHIRGDDKSRYESVGRVVFACQRAGIMKISFVTEPPARGG
ncbi:MAG: biopolymer transporter ExbD [Proteobacteria bacterium]|jgi:biopolymer transport protein ExbD|nr:biopolymer transporter ExbD [Methylibium sp.]MBY0368260.1 biopolymer transporter ExbD [Burkholderiaceae bacterium]MCH8855276.1 biopolymer transporter ExbD [Pseudomonadota bacterium]RTL16780.1 MAG: biopolymer transporter ExbD [Burkholderiales bacterium]|mmetsp:Transcript_1404/g.4154  ORF Transcript_1404/g.4154 Transcript_1404/m.4154 type:complete len:144 (+) Transcript_1404:1267-1698(+)